VDDSPHVRKVVTELFYSEFGPVKVETAGNGQMALGRVAQETYDLVTLDLSMPVMDGYTFLRIFRTRSAVPVLVISALSDIEHIEQALELGASGFLPKPSDPYHNMEDIREEFLLKVRQLLKHPIKHPKLPVHPGKGRVARTRPDAQPVAPENALRENTPSESSTAETRRRAVFAKESFPVVVIGCSSGGPPTLQYLLSGLPAEMNGAVLVAQHMPKGFTQGLVERLDRLLRVNVREASDGELVRSGEVLFCPGGHNMSLRSNGRAITLAVTAAAEGSCAPSVDTLFDSAAEALGERVLGIILTGMGRDGSNGVQKIKAAGGSVIAESEETAMIYGMPKQAAATGCVDTLLPLPSIAVALLKKLSPDEI
jgi:two-component system chemotaxis response regulator CheB